jgi:5-methylcytosine-specific restriction endonuclease McrBC regulatory subunit McrC
VSVTLAGAPLGARIGFSAAGGDNHQILSTVAPKAWRPDTRTVVAVPAWPAQRHHSLVLYETDRLHVTAPDPEPERLLTRCLEVSRRDDQQNYWDSSLLTPDVPPKPANLRQARNLTAADDATVTDLLQLFTRLDLLRPRAEDLTGIPRRSPLHRPLLYRRLLDEVFALVNSTRRGYRPVTAVRSAARGRVDPSSALRYSLTGDPRLRCHYDELTESTLLLGIICAGLEWIADGHAARSPFGGRFAQTQLRHDAVTLRRALAEVTVVPPRTALSVGPRLHLNRLDQPWTTALHLTLAVLAETEHTAHSHGPRVADAVELSVSTARLWETIVNQVLVRAGFSRVLDQQSQPAGLVVDPWLSDPPAPTGTHPDNVAWRGADIWIIDAKYKTPPPGKPPSRDDQYQMFAYSHLVADPDSSVRSAVLVYPGQGPTRTWQRGRDDRDDPRRLLAVRIPFPQPDQVHTATAWESYLEQATEQFCRATADTRADGQLRLARSASVGCRDWSASSSR